MQRWLWPPQWSGPSSAALDVWRHTQVHRLGGYVEFSATRSMFFFKEAGLFKTRGHFSDLAPSKRRPWAGSNALVLIIQATHIVICVSGVDCTVHLPAPVDMGPKLWPWKSPDFLRAGLIAGSSVKDLRLSDQTERKHYQSNRALYLALKHVTWPLS